LYTILNRRFGLCYTDYEMEYKFATERDNFADLASGQVFYSLPGYPAFPIRLASEIFQRCLGWWGNPAAPCVLYDPCCGAAYHLSVVAYLHWDRIRQVIGSDIDAKAVQLAERNLSLLTPAGMQRRAREISTMLQLYGKPSHRQAQESLGRLQKQVDCLTEIRPMQTRFFRANALDGAALREEMQETPVDIVFTDIPYGQHSHWQESRSPNPVQLLLANLRDCLPAGAVVAITSDKSQKVPSDGYRRLEKFQVGKRQVVILQPDKNPAKK
jgi:23S rRNA (guanine2535-N1)-methyltransferase